MNRGLDSVLSVYSDARAEYTKQLCVFLVPAYFQFYIDLLEKSKKTMVNESKKTLWQFQNYLNEIHDWNMEKVNNEINQIHTNCGCDYLEDLLTAVFIAHTKVLTAIRISSNNKKVEINIPKVYHFLFKVLCETSKLLWGSTYLFRDGIPGIEKQQNYRMVETILNEGILQAVRNLVPVKSILKDFVNEDANSVTKNNTEDDEDDDVEPEEKKNEVTAVTTVTAVTKPSAVEPSVVVPSVVPSVAVPSLVEPSVVPSVEEPLVEETIIINDKPSVSFGDYDTVFDSDNPDNSDMLYDPKLQEHDNTKNDSPAIEILDEKGSTLLDGIDFDNLDEPVSIDDYDELP
jgi:hypothetical protein